MKTSRETYKYFFRNSNQCRAFPKDTQETANSIAFGEESEGGKYFHCILLDTICIIYPVYKWSIKNSLTMQNKYLSFCPSCSCWLEIRPRKPREVK